MPERRQREPPTAFAAYKKMCGLMEDGIVAGLTHAGCCEQRGVWESNPLKLSPLFVLPSMLIVEVANNGWFKCGTHALVYPNVFGVGVLHYLGGSNVTPMSWSTLAPSVCCVSWVVQMYHPSRLVSLGLKMGPGATPPLITCARSHLNNLF